MGPEPEPTPDPEPEPEPEDPIEPEPEPEPEPEVIVPPDDIAQEIDDWALGWAEADHHVMDLARVIEGGEVTYVHVKTLIQPEQHGAWFREYGYYAMQQWYEANDGMLSTPAAEGWTVVGYDGAALTTEMSELLADFFVVFLLAVGDMVTNLGVILEDPTTTHHAPLPDEVGIDAYPNGYVDTTHPPPDPLPDWYGGTKMWRVDYDPSLFSSSIQTHSVPWQETVLAGSSWPTQDALTELYINEYVYQQSYFTDFMDLTQSQDDPRVNPFRLLDFKWYNVDTFADDTLKNIESGHQILIIKYSYNEPTGFTDWVITSRDTGLFSKVAPNQWGTFGTEAKAADLFWNWDGTLRIYSNGDLSGGGGSMDPIILDSRQAGPSLWDQGYALYLELRHLNGQLVSYDREFGTFTYVLTRPYGSYAGGTGSGTA